MNKEYNKKYLNDLEINFSKMESLEKFTGVGFKTLVEATKSSNKLPFGKTRDLFESYSSFHTLMKNEANYVLTKLTALMKYVSCKGNIQKRDDDEKLEIVIDANDTLLEKVGILLDEISGIRRNPEIQLQFQKLQPISGSWNENSNKRVHSQTVAHTLNMIFNKTRNIEKPQLKFDDKVNNNSEEPFKPKIEFKYNMLKPLAILLEETEDGLCQFTHPYEYELNMFRPSIDHLKFKYPQPFKRLEETSFYFITFEFEITAMIEDLKKYKEISVDLEHHSYRSFQGFTCLMQISTRDTDYIIDTLALRSKLQVLNEVFTDPNIVKVFHGAESDILWLQKDFGIYVVNMFDTYQAAKLLNYPKLSLAYLLFYYCKVDAKKHFQLADWRIRPIPEELIIYAREDTHYLLYIYDNLKNALLEKANGQTNLLKSVISESNRICLKKYKKPVFGKEDYLDIYHRSKKLFDNRQKYALQHLFEWRDRMARECDESYAYVLPNHMMLNISEVLPREAQGILACCNPIPTPVRQNLFSLHQIVLKAREQPLIQPILEEQRFYRHTTGNATDSPFQWPHDLNYEGEFRDDLPVLINAECDFLYPEAPYANPIINVFEQNLDSINTTKLISVAEKIINLSPYHRYKLAKNFSESLEIQNLRERGEINTVKVNIESETIKPITKSVPKIPELPVNTSSETASIPESSKEIEQKSENRTKLGRNKRKAKQTDIEQFKKPKKEGIDLKNNSLISNILSNKSEKMKKKNSDKKVKEFQPFDYNSVNYEQYKTASYIGTASKKISKNNKHKKRHEKKNLKISI